MKEKLKKFFSKDNLFIWICTLLIALFVVASVLFYKKDVKDYENKNKSNIVLNDDEFNLNTSWNYTNNTFSWNWQTPTILTFDNSNGNNITLGFNTNNTYYVNYNNSLFRLESYNGSLYFGFQIPTIDLSYSDEEEAWYYNGNYLNYVEIPSELFSKYRFRIFNNNSYFFNLNFYLTTIDENDSEFFYNAGIFDLDLFSTNYSNITFSDLDFSYFDYSDSDLTFKTFNNNLYSFSLDADSDYECNINDLNNKFYFNSGPDTFFPLYKIYTYKVDISSNVLNFVSDYMIDFVDWYNSNYVSTLQNNYDTLLDNFDVLQDEYNAYISSHSYTNSQYQALLDGLSEKDDEISDLQDEINDLQNQLNSISINENENVLLNYKDSKFYYNGSQIYSSTNLWTEFDVDTGFTYLDLYDGEAFEHLDYVDVLYDTITIDKSLLYVLTNSVGPSAHIIFYNNNSNVLDLNYPYEVNDTNTSNDLPFPIELYDSYTFNKIRVYNLNPNNTYGPGGNKLYLSSSNASYNYLLGYQVGYDKGSEALDSLQADYDNLDNSYNSLNSTYNNLLQQYNDLASGEYTFSELFWSISSVPFGVLASGFNVNVLGVNLAAIITGLFTALLIIWLIKKFLK